MADRTAQGAFTLTSLSSVAQSSAQSACDGATAPSSFSATGVADAAAKADRTSVGALALTSPSSIAVAETGSAALMASIQKMRMTATATSALNADASALFTALRQSSTLDTGSINAVLSPSAPRTSQEGQTRTATKGASAKGSFTSVVAATTSLEGRQASLNEVPRSGLSASALAQADSAALNEAPRVRSVSGYGQLDHLNMDIIDTITLDLSIEG